MRTLVCSLCLAVLLASCASPKPAPAPDNFRAADFVPPAAGSLIVLLPTQGKGEAEAGARHVASALGTQLAAAGFRVAILEKSDYEALWSQVVADAGGIYDPVSGASRPGAFGRAISSLARKVCAETHCAMVIQQRLVHRSATLRGEFAEWDGQRRPIPIKDARGSETRFRGTAVGLSIELSAVTSTGDLAFRNYGGVTLPYALNPREARTEPRTGLFDDDREIAEGVGIALAPLVPLAGR